MKSERFQEAGTECQQAYAVTHDPALGLLAARALFQLGQWDAVVALGQEVRGEEQERHVSQLVARSHLRAGRPLEAERAYRRALAGHRRAGDRAEVARSLYGLYYLAWQGGRYGEALALARQAMDESRAVGDTETITRAAHGLFTALYELGDLRAAAAMLDELRELQAGLPPDERARFSNHQGVVWMDQGRLAMARFAFAQAAGTAAGGDRGLIRGVHLNMVEASLDLGDGARARDHLASAWRYADASGPTPALLYWRGRVEEDEGKLAGARQTFAAALQSRPAPEWRWRLEYERGRVAEQLRDVRAAEDGYESAARVVEEMRDALGFDEFKGWLLERRRRPFEALFRLHATSPGGARQALATFERSRVRGFADAFILGTAPESAEAGDPAARVSALRMLLPALRGSRPPAGALPAAVAADIQAVGYFEAEERVWIMDVSRKGVRIRRLDTAAPDIRALVDRVLAAPEDSAAAERLGQALLPDDVLVNARPDAVLYIVPDGAIARVPFAALRRHGRYLVEDHALAYVPTFGALPGGGGGDEQPGPPVVIADAAGDLPGAAAEASEVAGRLSARAITGASATRQALLEARSARVLHVAVHAGYGQDGPWLKLADGRLAAADIVAGKLAPRLAVLASCVSGTPRGRGLWGTLAAAFLAAGTRSVVAALWSIDDQGTRELVRAFYEGGGATDPALALARAQRAFIAAGRPAASWAPFVLIETRALGAPHSKGASNAQ
jgi:tetratricopeptide (TPR) repeat protein